MKQPHDEQGRVGVAADADGAPATSRMIAATSTAAPNFILILNTGSMQYWWQHCRCYPIARAFFGQ